MKMNKMKTICFINSFVYHIYNPRLNKPFGGAEVQLYFIIESLKKTKKYQVSVLGQMYNVPKKTEVSGVNFWNVHDNRNRPLRNFINQCKFIYYLYSIKADVYVLRSMGVEAGIIGIYCKFMKKKFVYMVAHEWDVSGLYAKDNGLTGKFSVWGMRQASLILVQSREQKDMLKNNYGRDSELFPTIYDIPDTILPITERDYILWVGRIEEWKHPEIFLELAKIMPDQKFVMIVAQGNYEELYNSIRKQVAALTNVEYIEQVPFVKIDNYFKHAKLFINTSDYEGFPNTYVQAAKNGTPVLALRVNPDNILIQHQFGNICNDIMELKQKILSLFSNDLILKQYSNSGRSYAKTYHDAAIFGLKFAELIEK